MSESDYEYLDRLYEQIDELQSQVVSLHKALDKACHEIEHLADDAYGCQMTTDEWKEWCMKDD